MKSPIVLKREGQTVSKIGDPDDIAAWWVEED